MANEPGTPDGEVPKEFLGMPYDFRPPTAERTRSRMWTGEDPRLFPPKSFGWGYTINFYWIFHPRAWSARRSGSERQQSHSPPDLTARKRAARFRAEGRRRGTGGQRQRPERAH